MDGLVILANTPYIRVTEGNPKHSIAFKVRGDNVKEAKVTFIEWNVGKTGVFYSKSSYCPYIHFIFRIFYSTYYFIYLAYGYINLC